MTRQPHRGRRQRGRGRTVQALLASAGYQPVAEPLTEAVGEQWRWTRAPARGWAGRGLGWCASMPPVSRWRMTSDQAPVLWPWIAAQGLPPTGALMGVDLLSGGAFHLDPLGLVLDETIPGVTNPNVFIFGKPGQGKSGTVKAFCIRMLAFGYRVLVLGDVKDEYEALCRALGVQPLVIGPGLPGRINPLDPGPLGAGWESLPRAVVAERATMLFGRWLGLVRGLVGSQRINEHPVPFTPSDSTVVSAVLADLTGYAAGATGLAPVTIPALHAALADPDDALVAQCRYRDRQHFWDDTRLLRDALAALITGPLGGLFDAATTIRVDWSAPIQSLSLSRLAPLGDEAVGIALTCLSSWGSGARQLSSDPRIVIRDETWKQMRLGVEAVKALDADLRLSRQLGDIPVVCYHKPSDALSVGAAGSQAARIAQDLLHLADIKVLHGQDAGVADDLAGLLGLNEMATRVVTDWAMGGKGRALWRVGDLSFKVQVQLTPLERDLTWTNEHITPAQGRLAGVAT